MTPVLWNDKLYWELKHDVLPKPHISWAIYLPGSIWNCTVDRFRFWYHTCHTYFPGFKRLHHSKAIFPDCSTSSNTCLYPFGHYIHLTDDYCFVSILTVIPTILLQLISRYLVKIFLIFEFVILSEHSWGVFEEVSKHGDTSTLF